MLITIWRHGEAGSAASDRERELTERGRADIALGAGRFRAHCQAHGFALPPRVLFSDWRRTEQTASLIAAEFCDGRMQALSALRPGRDIDDVDAALEALFPESQGEGHLLLVSHQPLVSRLVDHYLGDYSLVPPLPPGGLVTLSMDIPAAGCGTLQFWSFPPDYKASR